MAQQGAALRTRTHRKVASFTGSINWPLWGCCWASSRQVMLVPFKGISPRSLLLLLRRDDDCLWALVATYFRILFMWDGSSLTTMDASCLPHSGECRDLSDTQLSVCWANSHKSYPPLKIKLKWGRQKGTLLEMLAWGLLNMKKRLIHYMWISVFWPSVALE